jgi:hypothetical protein
MNTELIFEILDLAVSLAKAQFDGDTAHDTQVARTLLDIVQAGAQAYKLHTGEPIDESLLTAEAGI